MGMISVSCTVCMVDDVGDVSITIWDNVLGNIPRNVGPDVLVFIFFFDFCCFWRTKEKKRKKRKYFRKLREEKRSPFFIIRNGGFKGFKNLMQHLREIVTFIREEHGIFLVFKYAKGFYVWNVSLIHAMDWLFVDKIKILKINKLQNVLISADVIGKVLCVLLSLFVFLNSKELCRLNGLQRTKLSEWNFYVACATFIQRKTGAMCANWLGYKI